MKKWLIVSPIILPYFKSRNRLLGIDLPPQPELVQALDEQFLHAYPAVWAISDCFSPSFFRASFSFLPILLGAISKLYLSDNLFAIFQSPVVKSRHCSFQDIYNAFINFRVFNRTRKEIKVILAFLINTYMYYLLCIGYNS